MRKRVIRSLILGALCVMISSFLILTPIFIYSFQLGATKKAYNEMQDTIDHIKPIAQMSLGFRTSKMNRLFNESMNQLAYFSKSNILFMDVKGNVIWANKILYPDKIDEYAQTALKSMQNKGKLKSKGILNGLYGKDTITIGEFIEDETGLKSWAVFCSNIAPNIMGQYKIAFLEILTIEIITLSFVAIFLFLFSRNITIPLNKINNTLKEFAKGNFDKRVKYSINNEIGELAQNINHMADTINNLEKMRADFISDITHELRTPMTTISGFIEGILDGTINKEDQQKYLAISLSETKRLSTLVNELLNLTRMEDQVKALNFSHFDLEELSKVALIKFEDILSSKNINVNIDIDGSDFIVNADRDKIIQVLTNLIHNAAKFTPQNGTIELQLKKLDTKCQFSIKNTGSGIESDKLSFIWERFYKADNSRSTDRSGVGIGLYIVKKIIEAHDQKITVTSIPNENTTFTFTLNLA